MHSTAIAIAVVEHDGQFLVGKRPEGVALAGLWEFPGGKVQPGETAEAAAVRECLEETGLEINVAGRYPTNVERYDHAQVELNFFRCHVRAPASVPYEPFRWVSRDELSQLKFPAGNRGVLAILLADEK